MTKVTRSLIVLCVLGMPVAASATGGYWGIGLSGVRSEDELGDAIEPRNLYAQFGHDFTDHVGMEAQTSITLADDEFEGIDWSAALVGLYVKGTLPVSESVKLSVLGGYASVDLAADVGFGYVSTDESGPSYGFGADFGITGGIDLSVRYMRYLEEDGLFSEVTGLNVALQWSY